MIDLSIPGFCPRPQLKALESLAAQVPENGVVVEVGSLFGRSAYVWASSTPPSARIFCVDPWAGESFPAYTGYDSQSGNFHGRRPSEREFFLSNMGAFASKVTAIRARSPALEWTFGNAHVIYLDADHIYESVRADLEFWHQHLAGSGILCGDDFSMDFPGVVKAVREFSSCCGCKVFAFGKFWALLNEKNRESLYGAASAFQADYSL